MLDSNSEISKWTIRNLQSAIRNRLGVFVAKTSMIAKAKREPKFSARRYNRCQRCGRPRGYLRKFQLCRICFRNLALSGEVPGVTKSSW